MATIAAEQPAGHRPAAAIRSAAGRVGMLVLVLAILWGLWEGYRWLWIREGWTWPWGVDTTTIAPKEHKQRPRIPNPTTGGGGAKQKEGR